MRWWYPHWRRLQEEVTQFHSGTVLTKNECLHCDWICLNLKPWWCLVLGSANSKMSSACTGMWHLTILKSMASRISRLRSLRGAQFRSFSNEDILVKRLWSWITNVAARRWMLLRVLMSLIRYGSLKVGRTGLVCHTRQYFRRQRLTESTSLHSIHSGI